MAFDNPPMERFRRHWPHWSILVLGLVTLLWAALAPLRAPSREVALDIPAGTHLRAAARGPMLPEVIRLTLGVQDVLLVRNHDSVAQILGAVTVAPRREFRLPFEEVGEHEYASSAHAQGRVIVRVAASPEPGWERVRWRWRVLVDAVRYLPLIAPDR
jgi:hypothetical protein